MTKSWAGGVTATRTIFLPRLGLGGCQRGQGHMHWGKKKERTEREIKKTIPFTIVTKRIKYLGINVPKVTKDLYIENYKTLMKEIKGDTNREIYHVHGSEESI